MNSCTKCNGCGQICLSNSTMCFGCRKDFCPRCKKDHLVRCTRCFLPICKNCGTKGLLGYVCTNCEHLMYTDYSLYLISTITSVLNELIIFINYHLRK